VDKKNGAGDGSSSRDEVFVHPRRHHHHHKHKYHRGSSVQPMGREESIYEGYVETLVIFWILASSVTDIRKINTIKNREFTRMSSKCNSFHSFSICLIQLGNDLQRFCEFI